jgi:hypothetical protein
MVPAAPSAREGEGPCRTPMGRGQRSRKYGRGRRGWRRCTPGSRVGSPARSHAGGCWPTCVGWSPTWGEGTVGSWPSTPGRPPRMGCSGCWPPPTGTLTWSGMTCGAMWWSSWATRRRCWWWMRPGFSRRARPRWACSASIRARPARSTTASWGCSWPTPAPGGGRSSTGSCTCPRRGPRIGRGVGLPGCLSRSGSGPSPSWPRSCSGGPWMPACRLPG